MRCIYCEEDNKLKDRADHSCKKCRRQFAFEPTTMYYKITDPAFKKAIESVSDNHTVFFTPRQLYYQVLRRDCKPGTKRVNSARKFLSLVWVFVVVFVVVLTGVLNLISIGVALGIGAALLIAAFIIRAFAPKSYKITTLSPKALYSFQHFNNTMLSLWTKAHNPPPKMLPEGGRLRPALRQTSAESDIQSYSFDRLLVCDKAETADMLLANNMHFETNTPIVSIDGYPQDVFASVMDMVQRNPNLKVFALHDADAQGCLLPLRLREDPAWFPQANIQIFDIGLRPRQITTMPAFIVTQPAQWIDMGITSAVVYTRKIKKNPQAESKVELPRDLERVLSLGERQWLAAGYRAELAEIKPSKLMRAIYQSFNRTDEEAARLNYFADHDPLGFFQTQLGGVRSNLIVAAPNIAPLQLAKKVEPIRPPADVVKQPDSPPSQWPTPPTTGANR